jgi:hypothetical protein
VYRSHPLQDEAGGPISHFRVPGVLLCAICLHSTLQYVSPVAFEQANQSKMG